MKNIMMMTTASGSNSVKKPPAGAGAPAAWAYALGIRKSMILGVGEKGPEYTQRLSLKAAAHKMTPNTKLNIVTICP